MSKHETPAQPTRRDPRRRRALTTASLATAAALLLLLALGDFLPPGGHWWSERPMTVAALSTVVGTILIGVMLQRWMRESEAAQLERVSTVAYRGLAQQVNDAGRNLVAPVIGADLGALAVPSSWGEDLAALRGRLRRLGHAETHTPASGWWQHVTSGSHGAVLEDLLADPEFVGLLFRCAASERRALQQATAAWAPVMLISSASTTDLGRLRFLTDSLEYLEETVRPAHVRILEAAAGAEAAAEPVEVTPAERQGIAAAYWAVIRHYERLGDEFASSAALPSDELMARHVRGGRWLGRLRRG